MNYRLKKMILAVLFIFLTACATSPPKNVNNLCSIFNQKQQWLNHSQQAFEKWGIPIPVQMAIMHQESRFIADAAPSSGLLFGFIPVSTAYGYAQAIDDTWDSYLEANNIEADRDDFAASCDFIGWYNHQSFKRLGINKTDVYNLYLAYHEGHGGYQRKTHLKKPWLLKVAKKVEQQANQYQQQLLGCQVLTQN